MKKKLLFLRKFSNADTSYLKDNLDPYYDVVIPDDYSLEGLSFKASDVDAFLGSSLPSGLLSVSKKLKLLQVPGIGIDKLDTKELKERGITVCNSKSNAPFVAEYAVAMLMALLKKIPLHDRLAREGKRFSPKGVPGEEIYLSDSLKGKTIGFVGFGSIAQNITSLVAGFKCRIIANVIDNSKKRNINPNEFVDLKKLLSISDIVIITLPLTTRTKGLISFKEFELMKKSAYLINVARGPIINEEAFYNALKDIRITGAAIDVWNEDTTFPFKELDNIILSSYRAGYIRNDSPHLFDAVINLKLFAEGKELINTIDLKKGY